jgi:hypothetical protein
MAGFTADGIVEPLDFDLRPYVDLQGTIKEPTSAQVQAFMTDNRKHMEESRRELFGDAGDDDVISGAEWLAALEKLDEGKTAATLRRNAEIYAALCSGKPTAAQLGKLPYRVMIAFTNWISNEVLNPEAVTGAGNAQVIPLPSSAAG